MVKLKLFLTGEVGEQEIKNAMPKNENLYISQHRTIALSSERLNSEKIL